MAPMGCRRSTETSQGGASGGRAHRGRVGKLQLVGRQSNTDYRPLATAVQPRPESGIIVLLSFAAEPFEYGHVDRIETLANAKTNTPNTMKAMRTEKATDTSTTSGMPRAPVAARMSPFSSDMKPITWVTAL